jgi:hypothetical protein
MDDAGIDGAVLFDDTTDDLDASSYEHPLLFKLTAMAHGDMPKFYFGQMIEHAGFATIP